MNKIILPRILGITLFAMLSPPLAHASPFQDVPTNHANAEAIDYVKANSIVGGYPDGSYKPDNQINRAELVKIIVGAQFDTQTIDECIAKNIQPDWSYVFFPDVPKDAWFSKYICVGKVNNIVGGYPNGTFKPEQNVNFVEAAKIIANGFKMTVANDAVWYKPFVEKLGEMKAIPTTIAAFDKPLTRGEMAEMVYRLRANVANKASLDYQTIGLINQKLQNYKIYFSSLINNKDMLDCSKTDWAERKIPTPSNRERAALDLLFQGPTASEKSAGYQDFWITQNNANKLKRVFIKNDIAYLDWEDIRQVIPNASTSCGSASFFAPIQNTLLQLTGITKVIHAINGDPKTFYEWMQMGCDSSNNNCDKAPYLSLVNSNQIKFDACGMIAKYSDKPWYKAFQTKLKTVENLTYTTGVPTPFQYSITPSGGEACLSLDESILIFIPPVEPVVCRHIYKFNIVKATLTEATGPMYCAVEFGARVGDHIPFSGEECGESCIQYNGKYYFNEDKVKDVITN